MEQQFLSISLEGDKSSETFGRRRRHPTKLDDLTAQEPVVKVIDGGHALIVYLGTAMAAELSKSLHITEIEQLALTLARRVSTELWNAAKDAAMQEADRKIERMRLLQRR